MPISRAKLIADAAIDGEYRTVALMMPPERITSIACFDPAPPTMKNSERCALRIAASTPMP